MKKPHRTARREDGQIIVMVGLMAIVMIAFVGLAIDVGRLYATKAELSRAVDAAALSGILEFDGTAAGLTDGENAAEAYFDENEPGPGVTRNATASGSNEMIMEATKEVDMIFLSLLGISTSTVSARAKAGFGTLTVDAALVLDATGSMEGTPISEAKTAAKSFKNILLGSAPSGNVAVGVNAYRGCFRSPTPGTLKPMAMSKDVCVIDGGSDSEVISLSTDSTSLGTQIDGLDAEGGSGTNTCGGLAKGWEVLEGTGNHTAVENNRRYLVLLADGDNAYYGHYSSQETPYESPHTYQTKSCRPPDSCSNVGGEGTSGANICHDGLKIPFTILATDNFTNSCNNWNNSTGTPGFAAAWTRTGSGNNAPALTSSSNPDNTNCHVRMRGDGTICRPIDLTGYSEATVSYMAKDSGWESGDRLYVEVSTTSCSTGFTTVFTHDRSDQDSDYDDDRDVDISAYAGQTVYIRWRGGMTPGDTGDTFYMDSFNVSTGSSGSANGYVNGSDGSGGTSCLDSYKRERQLDILTYDMAKALKADGVEIFVVAFGVCETNSTVYTSAQCDSQIGNTDHDDIADQRLLKCMASSTPGGNDHYHYAASASELNVIFTTIANQIAHRLIE